MKKCLSYILAAGLLFSAAFTSCKKDEKPKTVKVAAQNGVLTSGEAGTVTFAVTTENIKDGNYTATVDQLPAGITVQGQVTVSKNSGTLTLAGSATSKAGVYNDLTLTIDGAKSKKFTLTVTAATYTIGVSPTTLPFGSVETGYTQPQAQTVTVTNTGTGTVTLNALPAVANYTLTALSKTTLAAGETATFTVRPVAGLAAGTYNPAINITGSNGASATVNATFTVTEVTPGTSGNPFKVATAADLEKVGTGTDGWTRSAYYEQTANITIPAGTNWTPLGGVNGFTGTYNGGGFSISNLAIDRQTGSYQGLFSYVQGGVVKNIALLNVNIKGGDYVGGVVGNNYGGVIQNCYVTGSVSGNGYVVGGVAGQSINTGAKIENCYSTCNVSGDFSVGGVAGYNSVDGVVQNCYATGNITGSYRVGGVAGTNAGYFRNSMALNKEVKATDATVDIGRVMGLYAGALSNNYARSTGMTITANGVAVTVTPNASGIHGADATATQYGAQSWWITAGNWSSGGAWDFTTVWEWKGAPTNLPVLRGFKDPQSHSVTP